MTYALLLLNLFWEFLKIGVFCIGGGMAALPFLYDLGEKTAWYTSAQVLDMLAVSESTPGPIGINSATYVGYTSVVNAGYGHGWAVLGSVTATFAVVLPSFILMLLISKFLMKFKNHPVVEHVFQGLRPAVVGLLAAAALLLLTPENFSTPDNPWQFYISIFLFAFAFIGSLVYKMNPIKLICFCGLAGWILF